MISGGVLNEPLCLQRLVFSQDAARAPLYFRYMGASPEAIYVPEVEGTSLRIPPHTRVSFYSLFNHFPEVYWRHWTEAGPLAFQARLNGAGVLRLWRDPYDIDRIMQTGWLSDKDSTLLTSKRFDDTSEAVEVPVPEAVGSWRSGGGLHVEVTSGGDWVEFTDAQWTCRAAKRPVRLAVGFTTFNRPAEVLANSRLLLEAEGSHDFIERIFIIDQGTMRVREHAGFAPLVDRHGSRIQIIEQGNFGGAGGFTRAIMEARRQGGASHMLLMDDDAELEIEAVRRSVMFHAISLDAVAVGGQMLNAYRPNELVESGGIYNRQSIRIEPTAWRREEVNGTGITFVDYNAWWFFTFPLNVIDRTGLPLPVFIRGDDIEFGLRLKENGIQTVTLPGAAVWHEPFYTKVGGWTGYYDLRNLLILAMLHGRAGRLAPGLMIVQWVFGRLVRFDYYSAWLFEQAACEFLAGPETVVADAPGTRQRITAAAKRLQGRQSSRSEEVHPRARKYPAPRSTMGWAARISRFILRNLILPSPRAETLPRYSLPADANWWDIARHDVVVLDDPNQTHLEVRRRDRSSFLSIGAAALGHAVRLLLAYPDIRKRYRDAVPYWSDEQFWWNYLQVDQPEGRQSLSAEKRDAASTAAHIKEEACRVPQ
jgi:galactofuranosylgalactofuranosylrhamnosyl-N-acetylglucosaminyl-diphospho-decaprenol beta-1,5/1,6-galactofuranosyltransferase